MKVHGTKILSVVTVTSSTTVRTVAKLFLEGRLDAAPGADRQQSKFVGAVSEGESSKNLLCLWNLRLLRKARLQRPVEVLV